MAARSLFATAHRPYYVIAPDYRHTSAGVRVMHMLCHALNEIGAEAYVAGCQTLNPSLRTPLLNDSVVNYHAHAGRHPIAIYPEVVTGNPLGAKTVVRYILNRPGHIGGDTSYDPAELLYAYDPYFVPQGMKARILTIPCTDDGIMRNRDNPDDKARAGACFYALKYRYFGHALPDGFHAGHTDLSHPARSPEQIAAILRKAERLYCYEPSAITLDAILCGCPVVYVMSDYMTERPAKIFFGDYGSCAAKPGEEPDPVALDAARKTLLYCQYCYHRKIKQTWDALETFFDDTQKAK